ncbi:hypothetical protein OAV88_04330 [bacterium]|nr:hypothetical protein [bacterium]
MIFALRLLRPLIILSLSLSLSLSISLSVTKNLFFLDWVPNRLRETENTKNLPETDLYIFISIHLYIYTMAELIR